MIPAWTYRGIRPLVVNCRIALGSVLLPLCVPKQFFDGKNLKEVHRALLFSPLFSRCPVVKEA
jgi:hypothetical protein